ncbi:MAG: GMC family oxidoreductase [Alphaproteobacteria bacterium]|nr:GMC family oxidoreductase [Alphaproteobacteria bacterium]
MTAFLDARTLPDNTTLTPDLAIIGGGPAGISLALALKDSPFSVALLESGGLEFEPQTQKLYQGRETGVRYTALDQNRLRVFGGSTANHWGGFCRPLDTIDFEERSWVPNSGWPFGIGALKPYFARAQALVEAGPWMYDDTARHLNRADGEVMKLARGGVYTSFFQFSKTRDDNHPTWFGPRYFADLKAAPRVQPYLHASITGLRINRDANRIEQLDVATVTEMGGAGKRFTVKPRVIVLACGAIENARLLLASNDVMPAGVGNQNDLVGRFFADHPIPRDVATLVLFGGPVSSLYWNTNDINATTTIGDGSLVRAVFSPTESFIRGQHLMGSLTTVENPVKLDEVGTAAVVTTAQALGVDASDAHAYLLGVGLELLPDPERRVTLSGERDGLGMPRTALNVTISDADFLLYRKVLRELGRQLLASRLGMLRLSYRDRGGWMGGMTKDKQAWWGNHHLGTTRMSADPKKGVVDADGRVHGIENLFVAGSSVFPTYGSSNPTMNLIALALRLADHLKTVLT